MSVQSATIDGRVIHGRTNDTFVMTWGGLGTPEPRTVRQPRPRGHGAISATSLWGPRVMPVRGWCGDLTTGGAAAAIAAFDALKAVLLVETSHLAVIRRKGRTSDEQMVVRLGSDVSETEHGGGEVIEWGFELVADDPRFYGTTLNEAQRTGSGSIALTVADSTTRTPPVIELTGATNAGALTLTNTTTGESLNLTGLPALGAGALLTIDFAARTVFYGGLYHPEVVIAGTTNWWLLQPGANSISVTGAAVAAGTVTRVRWRSARI